MRNLEKGGFIKGSPMPFVGDGSCVFPSNHFLRGKIGIGITTRNRPVELGDSCRHHIKFMPDNYKVVIVDDASDPRSLVNFSYRFEDNAGIARSKNKCLELLEDCDHIFLFDDDTYPIAPDWWKPYVESKEPHLMYQFKLPGKPKTDMQELIRDNGVVSYTHTRGAMLYIDRRVLDVVGGMDTRYINGFEHPDWTNRIHNAGLTTHRAMDVVGSNKLLYCLDQDGAVESSIKRDDSQRIKNHKLYMEQRNSKEYKEYK